MADATNLIQKLRKAVYKPASKTPVSIKVLAILLLVNVAFWVLLGITGLLSAHDISAVYASTIRINSVLMLGYAAIFLVIVWGINKRKPWAFYAAVAVLCITVIMTLISDVGIIDIAVVVFDIILLGFVFRHRSYFTVASAARKTDPANKDAK